MPQHVARVRRGLALWSPSGAVLALLPVLSYVAGCDSSNATLWVSGDAAVPSSVGGTGGYVTGGESGRSGTGGAPGLGGAPATGGSVNTGGIPATGGTVGTVWGSGGLSGKGGFSTATGGQSGGGGTLSTGPATDAIGQNPFSRSAASGILITSSDGLNGIELFLAADAKDGMFVAGATRNPLAMGLTVFDPGIKSEAFAARLDAQGKLLWSRPLKTCGVPGGIAAGPADTVYVLCPYEPDATTLMPSTCTRAAVVDKLAGTDGKLVFEAQVKVPAAPPDGSFCPYAVGVDSQGRSYVGGSYSAVFPVARAMVTAVSSAGQQDWTYVSEGATGPLANTPNAYPTGVAVDSNGDVIFAGSFNNWMKLGTTQLTSMAFLDQISMYNGFIGRISSSGTSPTGWSFGGDVFDLAHAIVPTSNAGFLVGGMASSTATIGGKTVKASAEGSAFVAQFASNAQAIWAKALTDDSSARGVAMAPDGKAHFVGSFPSNELVYTYDPATDQLTSRKTLAGDAATNELRTENIAVTTSGAIWISGSFKGTINLGTGALTTDTVTSFLWRVN